MMKRLASVVLCISLIHGAGLFAAGRDIQDLIRPLTIRGQGNDTVLVSDLFYAKDYPLQFIDNPFLHISYDSTTRLLVIGTVDKNFGATVLDFDLHGRRYSIPVMVKDASSARRVHTFTYRPQAKIEKATVTGSFNNWNKERDQLKDKNHTGVYELDLPLDPGMYLYKFVVDGKEIVDPSNPEKNPTGFDDFNSVLRISSVDTNPCFLHIGGYRRQKNECLFTFIYDNGGSTQPLTKKHIIALVHNNQVDQKNISISGSTIEIRCSESELIGKSTLRVLVAQNGKATNLQQVKLIDGMPEGNNSLSPSWDDGIIYSILIDRFKDGDRSNDVPVVHDSIFVQANYQGGDFRGIIQKIDDGYFDSLSVNVLWISPVYDNPDIAFREYPSPHRWYSGYHGYWPISDTAVEEKFGTMNDLKELIAKAHRHRMRVLLDFVAHHVHIDHPFYKQHPEWFGTLDLPGGRKNLRLWDEYRLSTWFEPYMPSFDFLKSPKAVEVVSDNAVWWLKETGADGFRHDAVKHVPNVFWRALTKKLKEEIEIPEHKEVYQIGETFGDYDLIASYVNNGQLSAQFNFNLSYFAIPVFIEQDKSFSSLDFHMQKSFASYGYNNLMGNIMDSHDKVRFMAYADDAIKLQGVDTREIGWSNPPTVHNPASYEIAKLYLAYMMTIPGLPVVYYGSEFGMTGADDPDNRRMMRFDDSLSVYEKRMLSDTRKIIKMRTEHSALRSGDFLTLQADTAVYSYLRADMNERLAVILNKSKSPKTVVLEFPKALTVKKIIDVTTGESFEVVGRHVGVPVSQVHWRVFQVQ